MELNVVDKWHFVNQEKIKYQEQRMPHTHTHTQCERVLCFGFHTVAKDRVYKCPFISTKAISKIISCNTSFGKSNVISNENNMKYFSWFFFSLFLFSASFWKWTSFDGIIVLIIIIYLSNYSWTCASDRELLVECCHEIHFQR